MPTRRELLQLAAAAGTAVGATALAGCSGPERTVGEDPDAIHLRVWNEAAADAYRSVLDGIDLPGGYVVEVEAMPWDEYWKSLPLDVADGSVPDLLWMNTANLAQLQANDELVDVGEILGDAVSQWEQIATEQYRIDEKLWGVPQLYERTILLANRTLTGPAKVDPSELSFDPAAETDRLRDAARALTVDSEGRHPGEEDFDPEARTAHGFSSHPDRTALLGPFIAATGGRWQDEEGEYVFASEQGVAAVQYLADLCHGHLAPTGKEVVGDPGLCRQLFVQGKLGLLQTGTYDLQAVASTMGEGLEWDIHPPVRGPEGTRPLVHTIAMVATTSRDDDRDAALAEVLSVLGSADGMRPLAEARLGIPAHRDLRGAWEDAWAQEGVDVSVLGETPTEVAQPEHGLRSADGVGAALGVIATVFSEDRPAAEAMPEAVQAAQDARG